MTLKKILILLLSIFFLTGLYYIYLQKQNGNLNSFLTNTKEDTNETSLASMDDLKIINEIDNYKLPEGEQVYNISHGEEVKGPKAEKISYNPLVITPGKDQTITITFPSSETVSSGVIFVTTDNLEKQKLTLKRVDQKSNTWSGTWTPSDTANKRFSATLYLLGPTGTYNNTMTFL